MSEYVIEILAERVVTEIGSYAYDLHDAVNAGNPWQGESLITRASDGLWMSYITNSGLGFSRDTTSKSRFFARLRAT